MAIRWWNINGRWNIVDKNFMEAYDIIFLTETHCNCTSMPAIPGFKVSGDPKFPQISSHGGIVAYIRCDIFEHIQQIRFGKCSMSIRFNFAHNLVLMAVYIYPYDSINFDDNDFTILSSEISYWLEQGLTPIIAGDLNARMGSLNTATFKALGWRYEDNKDAVINQHGRILRTICELLKISPINHSKFYNKVFDGGFTYFKAGRKSQIDLLLTNNDGRRLVESFNIKQTGWHLSDHLPLDISISIDACIGSNMIMKRSKELLPYIPSQQPLLKTFRYDFDVDAAQHKLSQHANSLQGVCTEYWDNPNRILDEIESCVTPIITAERIKRKPVVVNPDVAVTTCDALFKSYVSCLSDGNCTQDDITAAYNVYQESRCFLNSHVLKQHENEYSVIINSKDDRKLWNKIDWGGNINRSYPKNHPDIADLAEHFETLYQPLPNEDVNELNNLVSEVYIPLTDDQITERELAISASLMKKGGWDYSVSIIKLLISTCPAVILLLMNAMFFFAYPVKLAMSMLHAIPKVGNLMISSNYRGIQVQPLFGLLYDRIIANRITEWASINPEQSAFQKGKGTLNHIFTLRLLIALAKRYNKPLYIGFFDLSKAFDKVSRILLIKSLIKLGIGACLLEAIKATYRTTKCVLKGFGSLSEVFLTYSGIKQGAPSSVILFIIFMDDVIDNLKNKCADEFLIKNLHSLLHADDTLIFSLERELFILKCNTLIDSFHLKKLQLNLKKSSYMIINPNTKDSRVDLKLKSGWLPYKDHTIYLGALFTDSGILSNDIINHAVSKNKGVSVKFANFVINHMYCPITVKKKVLQSCIVSSLLYAAETWSYSKFQKVETVYRKGIKICMKMKANTPNEIVYVESGCNPLNAVIFKRQYNFWDKILEEVERDPDSPIVAVYKNAIRIKLPFIMHYINLHQKFNSAEECYKFYLTRDSEVIRNGIINRAGKDGHRATYLQINPNLITPDYCSLYKLGETDRLILTKYRSGSHYLNIQKGRISNTREDDSSCPCGHGVQTLQHILLSCNLTAGMGQHGHLTLAEFFDDVFIAPHVLRMVEHLLKLR